jgi:hypothetical protein
MAEAKDFLNPNSMLTPGIAGSITMMIANTLWVNFGLEPKYTALMLCLLLGLVVLAELKVPLWQKPVYYIINVLIIFSVSAGTNVVGITANNTNLASQTTPIAEEQIAVSLRSSNINGFFINSAMADEELSKKMTSKDNKISHKKNKTTVTRKTNEVTKLRQQPSEKSNRKGREFFQSWF